MTALNRMVLIRLDGRAADELRRLLLDTDGQDVIEYALLTAFIGLAGGAAWSAMLTSIGDMYTNVSGVVWNRWEPADPVGGGS